MSKKTNNIGARLTRIQKDSDDKKWYKDNLDQLSQFTSNSKGSFGRSETHSLGETGYSKYKKMKINYDLFNNKLNMEDFDHVCYPFGKEVGNLPADLTNKDIISGKIKALLGMEMKRPFSWKVIAVNEEATTRKEQEEFGRLKQFVLNSIMEPIQQDIETKYSEQSKGRQLTPDEQEKINQQVQEELKTMTPPEVKRYMQREHQDPAEALSHQLLEYLIEKEDLKMKFNKAWKHGLISGREIFWVGVINGKPTVKVVNPLNFCHDDTGEPDFIEQGEWATYEMRLPPSEISAHFGTELTLKEIDDIYEKYATYAELPDESFSFDGDGTAMTGVRVIHGEWKALKPMKFLYGVDPESGEPYEDVVDETYTLNEEVGDISITTEWIPTKYEGYQIDDDKYAFMREVPGQHKNLDDLYTCNLSYIGSVYDNLNSEITSLIDRMKYYQYMYNIFWYRVELLAASDDGKAFLLNSSLIPKSAGLSIEKWMYYFKVNKIGLMDPTEEGNKGNQNMGEAAKELDMSLISDIQKYMTLLEYIERRCGESVGITKNLEGQINSNEAVRNTQQNIVQSANIIEPYFEIHNSVKRNVLQALLEVAKVAYAEYQPKSLSYVLDDMSLRQLEMDYELLDNSEYGLFVSNSMKSHEALQMVQQLSHAALQNQTAELSDIIKVMRSESIQEAEELLKTAEVERNEREQQQSQSTIQAQAEAEEKAREFKREEWAHEMEMMREQEALKTERELQKQAMLSLGFNEDKDLDKDGMPDVMEVYKAGMDAEIKQRKLALDEQKFGHQKEKDKQEIELKKEKNKIDKAKANQAKKSVNN